MAVRTGWMRSVRLTAVLGLTLGLVAVSAQPAAAHASLISSDPGNGAVLTGAPRQAILQFDQPITPGLSGVWLFDGRGRMVPGVRIVGGSSSALVAELPPLQKDAYRLMYHTRDDIDLHQTRGAIVFGVGHAVDRLGQPDMVAPPSFGETTVRWLELAGISTLVGVAAAWLLIIPTLRGRASPETLRPLLSRAPGRLKALATAAYVAIVIGKIGQLLVVMQSLPGGAGGAGTTVESVLFDSRFGSLWLLAMALTLATFLAACVAVGARRGAGKHRANVTLLAAVVTLVAVAAQGSHGTNQDGLDLTLGTIRAIHLGAAGLWVGGLLVLVVLFASSLRRANPELPLATTALRQFGGLSVICVGLLSITGLLLVANGIRSPEVLLSTTYGLTLAAKLVAGVAAVTFGLGHTLLLHPVAGRALGPSRLSWSVPFEVGAMLVVLWGAGALGATPPAGAEPAGPPSGLPDVEWGPALDTMAMVLAVALIAWVVASVVVSTKRRRASSAL
jgi:copper transport protein